MSKERSARRLRQTEPDRLGHGAVWLTAVVIAWSCCTTAAAGHTHRGCQELRGAARESLALVSSRDDFLERITNSVLERAVDRLEDSSAIYLMSEIVAWCQQDSPLDPETYRRWAMAEDLFGVGDPTPLQVDAVFLQRLQFYGDCLQKWVQHEAELNADQAQLLSQQVQLQISVVAN